MRYLFGILIFPSDGTSRIRFTGQSQQAHSQPDTSGPPKTYLLGVADIILKLANNVKSSSVTMLKVQLRGQIAVDVQTDSLAHEVLSDPEPLRRCPSHQNRRYPSQRLRE